MARLFRFSSTVMFNVHGFVAANALEAEVHCLAFGEISYRLSNIYG